MARLLCRQIIPYAGDSCKIRIEFQVMLTHQELEILSGLCGGAVRTRFAPSPTGYLHLGHAYSALCAWQAAGNQPSGFHLRIDDLDSTRCKPEFTQQIFNDLHWLGLEWRAPVLYQSARTDRYQNMLARLHARDLIYPCYLTRKEADSLYSAPHDTQNGLAPAPSTRHLIGSATSREREASGMPPVWRLDSARAIDIAQQHGPLAWQDHNGTRHRVNAAEFGDVVLGRRDSPASYHLSTVIDDADSDITLVVRGADLAPVTQIHRLLQAVLELPVPIYWHHSLICDADGQRLAKRHDALSLKHLRETGTTAGDIAAQIAGE